MKSYIYTSWYLQTQCLSNLTNMTTNEVLHLHFLISTNIYCLSILNEYDDKWSLTFTHFLISTNILSVNLNESWYTNILSVNLNEYDGKWSLTFTLVDIYNLYICLSILTNWRPMKSYIYTSWYLQTYCLSILTNMTTNEVLHLHFLISTNIMPVNLNEYDDKWSLTFTLLDIYKHNVCQT